MPANVLGGDLVWWRSGAGLKTVVTLAWDLLEPFEGDELLFHFVLHDPRGRPLHRWTEPFRRGDVLVLHTGALPERARPPEPVPEGVLAVFTATPEPPGEAQYGAYSRLYSLVDWYSGDGELAALHNDHSLSRSDEGIDVTEVVVVETAAEANGLVFLKGFGPLEPGAIRVEVRNQRGDARSFTYDRPVPAFSLVELTLREWIPDFVAFCDGGHATVSGRLECPWLFFRPYVVTRGRRLSAYHAGDRYTWEPLDAERYALLGRGEVNPMVVLRSAEIETWVNVFNSHVDVDGDYGVDARLFDRDGRLVAQRDVWVVARREGATRASLDELIPAELIEDGCGRADRSGRGSRSRTRVPGPRGTVWASTNTRRPTASSCVRRTVVSSRPRACFPRTVRASRA